MESTREDWMRRIRGIIDKANDPATTTEERLTFLAQADRLMTKHAIIEFELEFAKPAGFREPPEVRDVEFSMTGDWDFRNARKKLYRHLAKLARCKLSGWSNERFKVIGYRTDLDYLDLIFTSALLDLVRHLTPEPIPGRPWVESLGLMRQAGRGWESCHQELVRANLPDYPYNGQPWERKIGVRFTKEFKNYAEREGIVRVMAADTTRWREGYAEGYHRGVEEQVNNLIQEQHADGGLVLLGRQEAIDELYLDLNPEEKPHPAECDCDVCHHYGNAQGRQRCQDANCQRPYCIAMRKPVKFSRARRYVDKTDYTAMDAGRRQGREVNLARGGIDNRKKEIS